MCVHVHTHTHAHMHNERQTCSTLHDCSFSFCRKMLAIADGYIELQVALLPLDGHMQHCVLYILNNLSSKHPVVVSMITVYQ